VDWERPALALLAWEASLTVRWRMPALTRRRDHDRREECWLIFYGDIRVGTIAVRSGIPHHQPLWGWRCGFYLRDRSRASSCPAPPLPSGKRAPTSRSHGSLETLQLMPSKIPESGVIFRATRNGLPRTYGAES
jgi:hypothetical protein